MVTNWKIVMDEDQHPASQVGQHLVLKWGGTKIQHAVDQMPHGLYLWGEGWQEVIHEAEPSALLVEPSRISARRVADFNVADIIPLVVPGARVLAAILESISTTVGTRPQATTPEDQYVEKVKRIPQVQKVWMSGDEDEPTILTIISAPRFDKAVRHSVYQAQIEILRAWDRPVADFRLINLNEIPESSRENIVPTGSRILWEK